METQDLIATLEAIIANLGDLSRRVQALEAPGELKLPKLDTLACFLSGTMYGK